jgi:PAS domain S-box-containing protein
VYRPVYGRGEDRQTVVARRTCLVGYAAALFQVPELVREGLTGSGAEGLLVELVDVTDKGAERVLWASAPGDPPAIAPAIAPSIGSADTEPAADDPAIEPRVRSARYPMAGRSWELRFTRRVDAERRSWLGFGVLAGGLLFTGLLGAFLLIVTGRADAIEELVARRTQEIELANASLRHEIAERARAEAQHQASEERLAAAQQVAHLGSWELDLATRRFLWSEELCRIHGVETAGDSVDFATFLSRVQPEDRGVVDRMFGQALRDGQPFGFRYRIVRPDGTQRTLDGRGEVTLDPRSRAAVRMHGTGQDVTELEQAEKELAARTVDLERSNAELERFAYVASHDLQEPLRAVASHVQILQEDYQGKLDADADECIRHAVEGARRMRDLINDYLAYSRVRTATDPRRSISAEYALAEALRALAERIAESGALVTHDRLPDVVAEPVQLAELLKHLVANAIKFRREEPPRVHVFASRGERDWVFSVTDNGIGIDPEHTGRIFRLFQRLHTQDLYPGTGIGLAICKKIVERHGGRIWVESAPGKGSTFRFTLAVPSDERAVATTVASDAGSGAEEAA